MERTGVRSITGGVAAAVQARLDALCATLDLAPIGIAHFALNGRFLLANDQLCALLGYPWRALRARSFQGVTAPDDIATCMALNAQVAVRSIPRYRRDMRFVRADGTPVRCRVAVSAVPQHGAGEPECLVAFVIRRPPGRPC